MAPPRYARGACFFLIRRRITSVGSSITSATTTHVTTHLSTVISSIVVSTTAISSTAISSTATSSTAISRSTTPADLSIQSASLTTSNQLTSDHLASFADSTDTDSPLPSSDPTGATTAIDVATDKDNDLWLIVGLAAAGVIVLLVVVGAIVCLTRSKADEPEHALKTQSAGAGAGESIYSAPNVSPYYGNLELNSGTHYATSADFDDMNREAGEYLSVRA